MQHWPSREAEGELTNSSVGAGAPRRCGVCSEGCGCRGMSPPPRWDSCWKSPCRGHHHLLCWSTHSQATVKLIKYRRAPKMDLLSYQIHKKVTCSISCIATYLQQRMLCQVTQAEYKYSCYTWRLHLIAVLLAAAMPQKKFPKPLEGPGSYCHSNRSPPCWQSQQSPEKVTGEL